MKISAAIWLAMSVSNVFGTRHSRLSQGRAFNPGVSKPYRGRSPESNLDNGKVGG